MNLNSSKIKFHMLWAKGNFLFQGLEHTTLFLILPSAPAPALALSAAVPQPKAPRTQYPPGPLDSLARTPIYLSGSVHRKQTVTWLLPKPQLFKKWLWQGQTSDLAHCPHCLWSMAQIPRAADLPGTVRTVPGHTKCGCRSILGTCVHGGPG